MLGWLRRLLRGWRIRIRFGGVPTRDVAQGMGRHQTELLRLFFGSDLRGALERRANFRIPDGLNKEALERYRELARRQIARGRNGVQRLRLRLVDRALDLMEGHGP